MSGSRGMVVAVTGAARGIGRSTAELLVAHGAKVGIGDLDADLASEVAARLGSSAVASTMDVSNSASFDRFLDKVESSFGRIDALVNNAGVMPLGAFMEQGAPSAETTIAVNLQGVIIGTKLAASRMKAKGRGQVVNVASMGGRVAIPGAAVYTASKFGVVGFTEALRRELRGSGVHVSLVLPTMVDTELSGGVPVGRGFHSVSADAVARGIVRAIESGRSRDVYVPRWMLIVDVCSRVFPAPVMNGLRWLLQDDRVLRSLDSAAREEYEGRIGRVSRGMETPFRETDPSRN
jgi:NAD(P)-dependent dehydrogenase (short-subunit alcohol dehydrogenase family)